MCVGPFKADSPLHVDADAVLAFPVAFQSFESIRCQCLKVREAGGRVQNVEPLFRLTTNTLELPNTFALGELPRTLVAITLDHRDPS